MGRGGSRSLRRRAGLAAVGLLVVAVLAFVVWASLARPATPGPLQAATDDPAVEVERGPVVKLRPSAAQPERGVVFYPGARVHREAYVAIWAPIVEETRILVLYPRMPLNLAVFGRSRAEALIAERRSLLPEDAVMVEVAGMNHAQFGRYGAQRGDRTATISDEQAARALTDAHIEFFADER